MATENTLRDRVALARPPAKLNLFLELLQRRDDGYHEIDTVMVPIDLCDELQLHRTPEGIQLTVDWLPSRRVVAQRLGLTEGSDETTQLLQIPESESNLVHQALTRFLDRFKIGGGFKCDLKKRIPAGAGMGGASSDAAAALRCAAKLCGVPVNAPDIVEIAASIGSDVPFFLGCQNDGDPVAAIRARGRGEHLTPMRIRAPYHFVIAFPAASLSTAKVYAAAQVPTVPESAEGIIAALANGMPNDVQKLLFNRLADPARKILPRIDEILNSMWRCGLPACQLTGSGSACFALVDNKVMAKQGAARLQALLEPGASISNARSVVVPARVIVQNRTSDGH